MKHFFTIATLLTSVSAFAQLPYNPDADNNGTIGASDLTSLLSVYGNGFSNGVLGEGSTMATMDMPFGNDYPYYVYSISSCCSSHVVDLTLIEEQFMDQIDYIDLNIGEFYNGLTITFLVPSYYQGYEPQYGSQGYSGSVKIKSPTIVAGATGSIGGTFQKVVWWNGEFLYQDSPWNIY